MITVWGAVQAMKGVNFNETALKAPCHRKFAGVVIHEQKIPMDAKNAWICAKFFKTTPANKVK